MKLNNRINFIIFSFGITLLKALEHGDTFILKQPNSEKYLSVATPFWEGSAKTSPTISINSLIEEPIVKATSRWTVRKVGFGKPGFVGKISPGDKILLENTATGFYMQSKNNTTVLKYETGQVGATSSNWEDPDNIITWNWQSENEIKLFSPEVSYKIIGVLPSAASPSFNGKAIQVLLNEQRGCVLTSNGIKTTSFQITKDSSGKPFTIEFAIAATTPTLFKIDSGKAVCVQSRFPLSSTNPRYLNGLIMPGVSSVDFDKLGNIVIGNTDYFPSSTEPFTCFAPLKQKISDLLYTNGIPSKIYPYIDNNQIIATALEKEAPWNFIKALNSIKYAKYTNKDFIRAIAQDGTEKDFDASTFFSAYSTDFMQGAKSNLRMQNPKIGNGKIVARQIFATNSSPLIVLNNVETSETPRIFTPRDDKGALVSIVDYDIDDKGVIWVLTDQSEIFNYNNNDAENNTTNKGRKVAIKSGADGNQSIALKNLFDRQDQSLCDRPLKMSIASGGPNEPDNITIALISTAGQLAIGSGGTYDSLSISNLSNLEQNGVVLTGVTSASVTTDGKISFVSFVNETRNSSNMPVFYNYKRAILPSGQNNAVDKLWQQLKDAAQLESSTESNFIPAIPKPQLTPDQLLKAGYASAEQKGFALLRFDFPGQDTDPEWPNKWTHRQYKITLCSKTNPNTRDVFYKANLDGGTFVLFTSRFGQKIPSGNLPGEDQSLIEGWQDLDIIRANQEGPILLSKEMSAGIDYTVAILGKAPFKGVWLSNNPTPVTAPFAIQIGFENEELSKVACGSKDHIWVTKQDNSVYKYNLQTKAWEVIPNLQAISIAGGSDGGLWFVDQLGSVKFRDASGNIFPIPGGDTTPIKANPYDTSDNPKMITPSVKFEKISAVGTANSFRLVAITNDKRLFSCDQTKPLTDELIFNVSEAAVAMSGLCSIIFPIDPANGFQKLWGGRTYFGWISGSDPSTDRPYMPSTWPYVSKKSNFTLPTPTTGSIDKVPEFLKTSDLNPSYKQAIDKGFSAIGNSGTIAPDQDQMDAEGISDKSLHVNTSICVVTGLQNAGYDKGFSTKIYKCNGLNSGGNGHELCLDPIDHSIITSWPCFGNAMRDISAGVDGTVCVLWGNSKIISQFVKAGIPGRTDLGFEAEGGALKVSVANKDNIWAVTPDYQVYKYSGNGTVWNKIDGIKACSIAGATDGGLWYIDGSKMGMGNLMFKPTNGNPFEILNGKGKGLVKVHASGSQTNFHLVAIDKEGNLFSANQANGLTPEGISNVKEASIGLNGLCALIFVPNSESTHQSFFKGGLTFIGWSQFATKPTTWGYPIPYREYLKKELSDYATMVPQYEAIEKLGFAPAGSRSWVVWIHRGFNDGRTIHSQHKIALVSGVNGEGRANPDKMYKIHTGTGFLGKGIVQLPLMKQNQSIITGWRGINKGEDKIRELTASTDDTVAAIELSARNVLVWKDPEHQLIENDPILSIPCPDFYAVKIACGGFAQINGQRKLLLWVLGINAAGEKSIYRYTGEQGSLWQNLSIDARAIGAASSRLFWIDKDGNLQWCNELISERSINPQWRNPQTKNSQLFKEGGGKDLKKLCVSGFDNTGNFAIVAIGGPNNQLYSAHTSSNGLWPEPGITNVVEAAVAQNGLCAVNFRINRYHPFEAISGAPTYIGWINGKKPNNWNNRA